MSTKLAYPNIFKNNKERFKFFDFRCPIQKSKLTCVFCKDILVEPYKSDCGCRFCFDCQMKCKQECPGCNISLEKACFTYDRKMEKKIFNLEMRCMNELCVIRSTLKDLHDHLKYCRYNEVSMVQTNNGSTKYKCNYCNMVLSKEDLYNHRDISGNIDSMCDNMKSICPYKCTEEVQDNIKMHLANCTRMIVECPMKNVGCLKSFPREEMDGHSRDDDLYHMSLMMKEINKIKNEYSKKEHSLDIDRALLKKEVCRVKEKLKLLKKNKMDHLDMTQHKYIFLDVAIEIEEVRMFNSSKEHSIIDDTKFHGYIMTFGLSVSDDDSTVCLSMKVEYFMDDNQERDALKVIGIKWMKSESVEDNQWCYLSDLNQEHASMIVKLTMTMDIFRQRIALKNHLSFIVEILDVPVEDKCQSIL